MGFVHPQGSDFPAPALGVQEPDLLESFSNLKALAQGEIDEPGPLRFAGAFLREHLFIWGGC